MVRATPLRKVKRADVPDRSGSFHGLETLPAITQTSAGGLLVAAMAKRLTVGPDASKFEGPRVAESSTRIVADHSAWSDGLPLVDPAEDLIASMVDQSTLEPEEELGPIPPSFVFLRRVQVAETAAMAGCHPMHLPVVEAAIRASLEPDFNLLGIQTTTEPATPLIVVNGPLRLEISMNTGSNIFGNGNHANACIGRAVRLVLVRHGQSIPGRTDMATFGHPGKYTYCIAENEEATPWQPFHLDRNFSTGESVVTLIGADAPINVCYGDNQPVDLLDIIAQTMALPASNNALIGGEIVVLLSPQHATMLAAAGWSKQDVQSYLFEKGRLDAKRLPPRINQRIHDTRDWSGEHESIPVVDDLKAVLLLVAGGLGAHSTVIPTFGSTRASSTKIANPVAGRTRHAFD